MRDLLMQVKSPLFDGIRPDEREAVLGCIGYRTASYRKGEMIVTEEEQLSYIGILIAGAVDMIKEDVWGNKTLLERVYQDGLFGETFACGRDARSVVTFTAAEDVKILFLPFQKVMHTCGMACVFHHRLIENMVRIIADRNRKLLHKVDVISKKTLRQKILAYLSWQSEECGSKYFEVPLGRTEMAEFLCADRSALTRELARMREEGLIDYDRNCFRIL